MSVDAAQPVLAWNKAFQEKNDWRKFMDQPGTCLEDVLLKTNTWDAQCVVCSSSMSCGAHDHVQSANHWKNLWKRLDNKPPAAERALGFSGAWVQVFDVPGGKYLFNHLTGELDFRRPSDAPVAPAPADATVSPPKAAPATPVPPKAAAPTPAQGANMWEEEDEACVAAAPLAVFAAPPPAFAVPPGLASAPAPSRANGPAVPPAVRGSPTAYRNALESRQAWRTFMEPAAKELEDMHNKHTNSYGGMCVVCSIEMSRGIFEHVPSQNHWKKLWDKLNKKAPDPNLVNDWSQQWVEKFKFPAGEYLFNHVTGAQGFKAELGGGASTTGPPPHSAAPPMAIVQAGPVPAGIAPVAPVQGVAPFNLATFVWERHAHSGASQLQHALQASGQESSECGVCEATMVNVVAHLTSADHFAKLQRRLSALSTPPPAGAAAAHAKGPWVQDFCCRSSSTQIFFNHITAELKDAK